MEIYAWKPLSKAPKVWSVIAVRGLGMDRIAMYREGDGEDVKRWRVFNEPEISPLNEALWEYAPIAETLELDRAVQLLIVQAIGELIAKVQFAEDRKKQETARRRSKSGHDRAARLAEQTKAVGIRNFAHRIHVAFGIQKTKKALR